MREMISIFKKALQHEGFAVVEVLSQCPTYFGRKNKLGDAVRMMERYRDHTAPVGSPKLAENPTLVPRGIFTDEDQPEYYFADHIHRLRGDQDQAKSKQYIKY